MSDQQNQQQENAEIQAHNAVNHALRELNQAHGSADRRQSMQVAQEHLDQARLQLEQARHANSDNEETLS